MFVTFEIATDTVLKAVQLPVVGTVSVPITAPVGESSLSWMVFPPYPLAAARPAAKLVAPVPKSIPLYATQSPWSRLPMYPEPRVTPDPLVYDVALTAEKLVLVTGGVTAAGVAATV